MRKLLVAGLVIALIAALGWGWQSRQAKDDAELQLGLDSSRLLEQTFRKANALKVSSIDGRITARSTDPGFVGILRSSQTTVTPFSIDYFVDLRTVDAGDFRWDKGTRTLLVEVPDVTPARANIDYARATTTQSGVFISRDAGLRLQQKVTQAVTARAAEVAKRPENLTKAREAAREAIANFARLPLDAAGKGAVKVLVRFPFDAPGGDARWDTSRPIADVLAKGK